jgi:hypothetical protein
MENTLSVLLKHETDLQRAKHWLERGQLGKSSPGDADLSHWSQWNN